MVSNVMNYKKISEDNFEENHILWLADEVLVVACVNKKLKGEEVAEWCAYIGAVKEEEEWEKVRKWGSKLPRKIAEILFPFSETHRWR